MRPKAIILTITLLTWVATWASSSTAFQRLDSLIANQDRNIARNEQHLAQLKKRHKGNTSLDQEYRANYELYRAYVEFQNDSAQKYMRRNIDIARQLGDKTKESESTLNLMHLLNKAYLLDEVSMIARLPST